MQVTQSLVDGLGYDLEEAVSAFKVALAAHAMSENEPAPVAEPLVEAIVRSGGSFEVVDDPLPPPADLLAYTAHRRWRKESSGTVWNGWPIHTDAVSHGKYLAELEAIRQGLRQDGEPWKFADGIFRPITNADIRDMAIAARDHVKACFAIEEQVLQQIADGVITTTAEIDQAFA